ncbi:MAG TPA: CHAT domain-containing protein [Pyrinomonadaceae bacterium]|nr:CHAT domain-containing protein [Pyrinomonadaceae bacterium]
MITDHHAINVYTDLHAAKWLKGAYPKPALQFNRSPFATFNRLGRYLMKSFHRFRTSQKLSTTEELRRAQLSLINDPSGKFVSPYYWAAFAVYGGDEDY